MKKLLTNVVIVALTFTVGMATAYGLGLDFTPQEIEPHREELPYLPYPEPDIYNLERRVERLEQSEKEAKELLERLRPDIERHLEE